MVLPGSSKSGAQDPGPLEKMFSKMSSKTNGKAAASDVLLENSPPPAKKAKPGKGQAIEDIYQKKTQLEHILLRPDTYIGSVEPVREQMWIFEDGKMIQREIQYVPGLYKIFDEILVNAADNKQRDPRMDTIKIDIDQENNKITIFNNGTGIPVAMHKEEKIYVPSMIFGHLLTSSNFNDDDKKVTGGRNGYGAKLCNVFSTKFVVETGHKQSRKAFKQVWENNMQKSSEPIIKDFGGDDYTKVTFKPDLTKFKMEALDDDIVAIFSRRAYDVAASSKGVKVHLNGKRLPIKGFKDYVDLFLKDRLDETQAPVKFNYESVNERWEIAVAPSENGFQQISFVNSIATTKGGRHVDYISDMVVKNLVDTIKKKNKNGIDIKPFQIRGHLWIFVNCLIENPTFDSQTKEMMTLQAKSFGSKCAPSEKFYNGVIKSGIVENVLSWAKYKAENLLDKKSSGRKTNKIKGLPKLEDANDAGTKNSINCTLILTEGDSAKTLVVSGFGVIGRDKFGVFPLRGKLLNVREASHKQIMENAEINAIVKILGLQYKRKYQSMDDMKTLRYGKVMIMTDQDHDGSHIKGLIINFIHHNWPSLLKMNFIEEFITPIVKATKKSKGAESISFFSMPELDEWRKGKSKKELSKYTIKYYKGLGTSTSKEAKEYFTDMSRHRIKFKYQGDKDDEQITMAFSKKCVDQRKDWLTGWMEGCKRRKEMGMSEDVIYSSNIQSISFSDFVNKELVLFSNLDNERSIPCLVDGLKPGQRKVLFACFKKFKKGSGEIKVAQLAGSVSELSAYHHGEASLMSTIINLAQDYVGSNNINLLLPIGQFGTRLLGGKDAASPRYIFTKLSPLTRTIFDPKDDGILKNLYDDNLRIEPEWYCPIIPMVLVNGADGIGTGWMTRIPNFNPREVIQNLKKLIRGEETVKMDPWYKHFKGEIQEIAPFKYAVNGEVNILTGEKIEIVELPVGTWTQTYKEGVLEPMATGTEKQPAVLHDYKEYHTDTAVKFVVSMKQDMLAKFEGEGLHKVFKLQTSMSLGSMVLFDQNGCLKRYTTADEILKEFYTLRYEMYGKRRELLIGALAAESGNLTNQARFIMEKCDGSLTIENKKRKLMVEELVKRKYDSDPYKLWKSKNKNMVDDDEPANNEEREDRTDAAAADDSEEGKDFDYLLGMPLWSLTLERKEDLLKKRDNKLAELDSLRKLSAADMYNIDLDNLLVQLDAVEKEEEEGSNQTKKNIVKKVGYSKKAVMESAPSPMGQRVRPVLDDMIKKAEAANKIKENRGLGRAKGTKKKKDVKEEPMELDEYDLMAAQNDSLMDKLNSSTEAAPAKGSKATKGKKPTARKPKAPGEQKKKRSPKKRLADSSNEESLDEDSDVFSDDDDYDIKPKDTKKKDVKEPMDEYDFMAGGNDSSMEILNSSTEAAPAKASKATKEKKPTAAKSKTADEPKQKRAPKKRYVVSSDEESLDLDDNFSDDDYKPSP